MIELHAQHLAAQIEQDHVTIRIKVPGRWRKQKTCVLCQVPAPCGIRQRAADVRAGRRDVTGRPTGRERSPR